MTIIEGSSKFTSKKQFTKYLEQAFKEFNLDGCKSELQFSPRVQVNAILDSISSIAKLYMTNSKFDGKKHNAVYSAIAKHCQKQTAMLNAQGLSVPELTSEIICNACAHKRAFVAYLKSEMSK